MAETGLNIKMGVSGVSQFKQSIKTAQESIKTLDSHLALNEKQFKATGDAQEYMKNKSELLKVKLEEQKAVVAEAEKTLANMKKNGVDKASTAFQTMQRNLLNAKGAVVDTETEINNLGSDAKNAGGDVKELNTQLDSIGKNVSFEAALNGIGKITTALQNAAKKAINLGKKLASATMDSAHWADQLVTDATKYGLSTDQLQQMQYTANLIDTDVETIIKAQSKLRNNIGTGNKGAMDAFSALGIDVENHDWEQTFWAAGEALKKMTDEVEQEAYATAIFGKSWKDLLPLFQAGQEKYNETMNEASVVSEENINKLTALDDSYQKMEAQLETLKNTFFAELAPAIQTVTDALTEMMKQFNEYLQTEEGKEAMKALGDAVKSLFEDLTKVDFAAAMETAKGAIDALKKGLIWIKDNKNIIVGALEGLAIAFAGLKVSQGVLTFLQLVSGLKGLGGAGAGASSAASAAGAAGTGGGGFWSGLGGFLATKVLPVAAGAGLVVADSLNNHGNNDIVDENGNLTEEGKRYGYTVDQGGNIQAQNNSGVLEALRINKQEISDYERQRHAAAEDLWDALRTKGVDAWFSEEAEKLGELYKTNEGALDDLVEKMTELMNEEDWQNRENLDDGSGAFFGEESMERLNGSIDRMNEVVESNTTAMANLTAGTPTSADLAQFNSLPNQILAAVRAGVANIQVIVSAQQMGNAVTPTVSGNVAGALSLFRK